MSDWEGEWSVARAEENAKKREKKAAADERARIKEKSLAFLGGIKNGWNTEDTHGRGVADYITRSFEAWYDTLS